MSTQVADFPSHRSYMASLENKFRPYACKHPDNTYNEAIKLKQANKTYLGNLTELRTLNFDEKLTTKELALYAGLRYLTTGIVFPFIVSETLLQIQYLPNDELVIRPVKKEKYKTEEKLELETSDLNHHSAQARESTGNNNNAVPLLPPLERGVWGAIRTLSVHPTEGWLSLWKGQFANWMHELGETLIQPSVETMLNDSFDLYDDTIPLVHLERALPNVLTMVGSHIVSGIVLSPLEIIRTRLIVQSSSPGHRKYRGFFHALKTIIQEEGLVALYWSYNLFPTILFHTLDPLIGNTIPLVIDRCLNLSPSESPFFYGLAELGLRTLQLVATMPVDTIRKRLQCQIQKKPASCIEAIVETRPVPYHGFVDCAYRIITEEGGIRHRRSRKTQIERSQRRKKSPDHRDNGHLVTFDKSWWQSWGLGGLYRGFSMRLTSQFIILLGNMVGGTKDEDEW